MGIPRGGRPDCGSGEGDSGGRGVVTLLVPERLKANRAALLGRFVGG